MKQKIGRVLVETAVRRTIKDIQQDPERSIRNLIDMALNFAAGRFQQQFFEATRQALSREDSAYYRLVTDVVNSVETDRLVTFGMNLGYNGCTRGARIIRSIEAEEGFNIPWCLSLDIDQETFLSHTSAYKRLIRQGEELGIHTWQLHTANPSEQLLNLVAAFPDSAFVLFCPPGYIKKELLARAAHIPNLMITCIYSEKEQAECERACRELRAGGFLYGLHLVYQKKEEASLKDDHYLAGLLNLHPAFVFFSPDPSLPAPDRQRFYSVIKALRLSQDYAAIFLELHLDNQKIDSIISQDGCSGGFTAQGRLYTLEEKNLSSDTCFFDHNLKSILKTAFPKVIKRELSQDS